MDKDKIRVGVVGLGHRGRHMLKLAAEGFDCVVPAAACDIIEKNWYERQWLSDKALAEMYPEAKFYTDYNKMLEEADLDVVIVETGADIHADFCVKALEKNINVMTDIPVVANLKEAENLWKAAQKTSAMISVGANANEARFPVLLKDFYDSGRLGKPYCMEAEYIHWSMPDSEEHVHLNENGDWRKLLMPIRYCTHSLGPLLAILEEDLRTVSCFGTGDHAKDGDKSNLDNMACAQFQTDSGVVIRLMRNGRCRASIGYHSYRVFGTEGYMEKIDRFNKPMIRFNSTKDADMTLKEVDGKSMPPAYENNEKAGQLGHGGVDFAMMDHFLEALRSGEPAPISLREGLAMTLPGIYAEESAKRGGAVLRIRYPWDEDWTTEIV